MQRQIVPRGAIGPILLISCLILLFAWYRPPPRPTIAPPWALPDVVPFEWLPGMEQPRPSPAPVSGVSYQRVRLEVTTDDTLYEGDEATFLTNELEQAFAYVSQRFETDATGTIRIEVGHEPTCNLNGLAYTDQRLIQVFTCSELPRIRAVNIVAHEIVHQLAHDRYGEAHMNADLIVAEGVATWGAGKYWLASYRNFRHFVRENYKNNGVLLPLATSYVGRPVSDMNMLYYEWASFVEFLLERYGRDMFDAVYVSGSQTPGSAAYATVYGKSLPELENEWLSWLDDV